MIPNCLRLQARRKKIRCVWYGLCSAVLKCPYTYGATFRFISHPSPRSRTGQRQARRLGASLALISRRAASTSPLATPVGVFCYITLKTMMHTEGHNDKERYITSISAHVSERGAYQIARTAETNREQRCIQAADGREQRQNTAGAPVRH